MLKDAVVPKSKWEFDQNVADCFDDMLSRSIPLYDQMRSLTYNLGRRFVRDSSTILDLGASRGEALRPFVSDNVASRFVALEVSEPMRSVLHSLYDSNSKVFIPDTNNDIRWLSENVDAYSQSDLILSVLTVQFTPIEYRIHILQAIYDLLSTGGAFLFVEKVIGSSSRIDSLLVDSYYALKAENGYSYEDIQRKKASLEGVLVPVSAKWNEDMLRTVGFRDVDVFYRHLNFCGWVAIK
jgi:tRNA (cmo5U34)-methyltransferase